MLVPAAGDQFERGDWTALGATVARSQVLAERLLGNQVPETIALARLAREHGALAASAFGAGFGGSVWALVDAQARAGFLDRWQNAYAAALSSASDRAPFFLSRPGPGARLVGSLAGGRNACTTHAEHAVTAEQQRSSPNHARTFLQIAGARRSAPPCSAAQRRGAGAGQAPHAGLGLCCAADGRSQVGFVGVGGQGARTSATCCACPAPASPRSATSCPSASRCAEVGRRGRPEGTGRLLARPARLRAALRHPGRRPRLQRDAVGMARPGLRRGDEERQARRHRGAGGDDARRLLAARRARREAPQALRDDGELQLRPFGDAGLQHGPAGPVRRGPARRGRLPARPARDQVRQSRRRPVAARVGVEGERQPLSDARPRPGRQLHGHQPRRSLRLPGLDERARPADCRIGRTSTSPRARRSAPRSSSSATSTSA